jgi:hypothetical protein
MQNPVGYLFLIRPVLDISWQFFSKAFDANDHGKISISC